MSDTVTYHSLRFDSFPAGPHLTALAPDGAGGIEYLGSDLVSVLRMCAGDRTLEDHATEVSSRLGVVDQSWVLDSVRKLAACGWLKVTDKPHGVLASPVERRITTLAIPTSNRPQALAACLATYAQQAIERDHRIKIVVSDGSLNADIQNHNKSILTQVAAQYSLKRRYVGSQERKDFLAALVRSGASAALLEWATGTPSSRMHAPGVTRNVLSLLSAGEQVLSADDDTICHTWTTNERSSTLELRGHIDPTDTFFFESRQAALGATTPTNTNLFDAHDTLLGSSLSAAIASHVERIESRNACQHITAAITAPADSFVRITMSGIAGDSGMHCPDRLLFANGTTRWRMASSQTVFDLALTSREVSRIVRCATITHEMACMAGCSGLDGREILPPFIPVGRNQDGLFGLTLQACEPTALMGYIPVGVVHAPNEAAVYPRDWIPSQAAVRLADLISLILRQCPRTPTVRTVPDRMSRLGEHFIECTGVPTKDFDEYIRRIVIESKLGTARFVDGLLSGSFKYPQFWVDRLCQYRSAILESLRTTNFYRPTELTTLAPESPVSGCQAFIRMFGHLLKEWPQIWHAAGDLNVAALSERDHLAEAGRL